MANRNNDERNYAKPGDDKIVSGKGFLISMPSLKKSNPVKALLGGDKKKDEAQNNASKAAEPRVKENKKNNNERNNDKGNNRHNASQRGNHNHGGRNNDKRAARNETSVQGVSTEMPGKASANGVQGADRNGRMKNEAQNDRRNNRPRNDRNAHKNAQRQENADVRGENIAAETSAVPGEKNGGKGRDKSRRDNRRNKAARNENLRSQAVEAVVASDADKVISNEGEAKVPENDRDDRNRRRAKDRHENRKNVAKEQPAKDAGKIESGIVSAAPLGGGLKAIGKKESAVFGNGGLGGIFSEKSVNIDAKSQNVAEEEPVYVDKNRPLAEQIMEDMARRRGPVKPASVIDTEEKTEIVGVRFRNSGKIYYFAPGSVRVEAGDNVIVETARGVEYGFVAIGNTFVKNSRIVSPLKTVVRKATAQDTETYNLHRVFEKMSEHFFRYQVEKLGLEMALVYVEYTFDASKVIFYFTADGRVDFRELIKELAAGYKTRIELRQIGVRDEAKLIGGLGICGRPICCNSFLSEFSQVSIKMAKDQNLFLNSSKISGTCGRFMCCLKFEDESYRKEYEMTPKAGDEVFTPEGKGTVMESNAIKGVLTVLLDDKKDELPVEFSREQVQFVNPPKIEPKKEASEADAKKNDKNDAKNTKKNAANKISDISNINEATEAADDEKISDVAEEIIADKVEEIAQVQTSDDDKANVKEHCEEPLKEAAKQEAGMAVSEKNIIIVEESVGSSQYESVLKAYDQESTVAVQTTPEKTDGIAFADGVVTVDDGEAEIEKSILERDAAKATESDSSDFVISTESGSKSQAFADGVITIES